MPDRQMEMSDGDVNVASPGAYAVSGVAGDFDGGGHGLYFRDTRHLSRFVLKIGGKRLVARGYETWGTAAEFSLKVPGSGLEVVRKRRLGQGFAEEVEVCNGSVEPAEARLSFELAADFEDVFAVRGFARTSERGEASEDVREGTLRYAYRRGGFSRGTEVRVFSEDAAPLVERGSISLNLRLGAGESRLVRVRVTLEEGGGEVRLEERAPLYARAPRLETDWAAPRRSWERSVEDLESLTFDAGDGLLVPAAGAPWFMALFGRDSLITAYGAMILSPEPAKNVLRALARHQATERDDFTDAEPGKIAHELRRGEMAFFGEIPQTPYYGTADATPLFLILLDEVHRWTADMEFVREMEPAARRALAWILEHSDKVNGYVAYHTRSTAGLKNQSWKDSDDSMLFRDGTRAEGPIAPVEVQGYVYDALLRTAGLADSAWDDTELATGLRERAADLKDRFDRDFWMEDRGYYALALDGEGRRVDSITSNPGHLLWSGIVPDARARAVADRLMSRALFGGWGIRTMAAGEGGYDSDSYHNGSVWPHDNAIIAHGLRRYGFAREAERITVALLDAAPHFDYRLPELFAGYSREEASEPVEYPTSCSPQAWAAAAIPLLARRARRGAGPEAPDPTRGPNEERVRAAARRRAGFWGAARHPGRRAVSYPYDGVDLREHPEAYRIGRGEQGVFHAEPYKGELLPLWSFKTEAAARKSAAEIHAKFLQYKEEGDFVGMDVARKYLQMGYTRSRRYAKYEGGKKSRPRKELDPEKSRAAEIFHEKWRVVAEDEEYLRLKKEHRRRNG